MFNFRTDMAIERNDIYKKQNNIENQIDGIETEEEEKKILEQGQNEAVEAIKYWIKNGIDNTMNKYNKNS